VTKGQLARAPDAADATGPVGKTVRLVFIRHGESMWNYAFNRGFKPSFLYRWLKTTLYELYLLPLEDSAYLDSPLSGLGLEQCQELKNFFAEPCTDVAAQADYDTIVNGVADGRTLIVAETWGSRLTAFDVDDATGALSNRRVWAQLENLPPDGICLDAEGCVWVADPVVNGQGCVRVAEGGAVLESVPPTPGFGVFACALGGDDGRSLFLLEARGHDPAATAPGNARISAVRVGCPHAGWP